MVDEAFSQNELQPVDTCHARKGTRLDLRKQKAGLLLSLAAQLLNIRAVKAATCDTKAEDRQQDLESHFTGEKPWLQRTGWWNTFLKDYYVIARVENGLELNQERTPGLALGFTAV